MRDSAGDSAGDSAADKAAARMTSVQERLNLGLVEYLSALSVGDIDEVTVEAVANAAGVSRATAYRHFGDREGLLHQAAQLLTRRHADAAKSLLSQLATVAARTEEGFAYTAREIQADKTLRLLLTAPRSAAIDSVVRALSVEISGEYLRLGQLDGQVRADLTIDELIDWINEQQHLAIRRGLDEHAVRRWVRRFVIPALRPQHREVLSKSEMVELFGDLGERVHELRGLVQGIQTQMS
jgi:AcrR family transcriptional regulator